MPVYSDDAIDYARSANRRASAERRAFYRAVEFDEPVERSMTREEKNKALAELAEYPTGADMMCWESIVPLVAKLDKAEPEFLDELYDELGDLFHMFEVEEVTDAILKLKGYEL